MRFQVARGFLYWAAGETVEDELAAMDAWASGTQGVDWPVGVLLVRGYACNPAGEVPDEERVEAWRTEALAFARMATAFSGGRARVGVIFRETYELPAIVHTTGGWQVDPEAVPRCWGEGFEDLAAVIALWRPAPELRRDTCGGTFRMNYFPGGQGFSSIADITPRVGMDVHRYAILHEWAHQIEFARVGFQDCSPLPVLHAVGELGYPEGVLGPDKHFL